MDDNKIKEIRIRNFGCIRECNFKLSDLTVFIGPNDSGKSTIMRAAAAIVQAITDRFLSGFPDYGVDSLSENYRLEAVFQSNDSFSIHKNKAESMQLDVVLDGKHYSDSFGWNWSDFGPLNPKPASFLTRGVRIVSGINSRDLMKPGPLIPNSDQMNYLELNYPLASIYDAILSRDINGFVQIIERVKQLFPTVGTIQLINTSDNQKQLSIVLKSGEAVQPEFMSDGLKYYLLFEAISRLQPADALIVEEPETGLHPSRIADVVKLLRTLSNKTQILVTTHSPLVVNEFQPNEVNVVARDLDAGTRVTGIEQTKHFAERSKIYALGELWVSYANGRDEEDLVGGTGA